MNVTNTAFKEIYYGRELSNPSPVWSKMANFSITVSDLQSERGLTKYPAREKMSFALNEMVDLDLV